MRQKTGPQHGMSETPTYSSWLAMRDRCKRPRAANYKLYGGRGIKVCERWRKDFREFLADMGEKPTGHSIERIDNNGDYTPGNCRWATIGEQCRNRRSNIRLTHEGKTQTLTEWAKEKKVSMHLVWERLYRNGWRLDRALNTTVAPRRPCPHKKNKKVYLEKNGSARCIECNREKARTYRRKIEMGLHFAKVTP